MNFSLFLKIKSEVFKKIIIGLSHIKASLKHLDQYPFLQLLIFSFVLNFVLESLSRRSLFKGVGFVLANPLMFLFNILIILFTLTLTLLFSKKNFLLALFSIVWVGLGVTNYVLLGFRTTPLTAIDFYILGSVIEIIDVYINTFQIILLLVVAVVVAIAILYLWRKLPKKKAQFKLALTTLGVTIVLMLMVSNVSFKVHALSNNFGNLADAYSEYGFAYCFSTSLFDRGINRPDAYSEEKIDAVLDKIEDNIDETDDQDDVNTPGKVDDSSPDVSNDGDIELRPNVVMVQLESFFDVNHLLNFTFSENPTPNFTSLKKAYSYGYLTVPSIGAGTANTEFEIITGMNIEYFGAGEYPYKTILQTTTCESISYNLHELGYHSHAIHNNTGTFYDRNQVFQKLGFDSYSSIEYMNDVEYNPVGWAKDNILTTEIIKALDASFAQDFIYTISVQPHGKYPDTIVDENQKIKVFAENQSDSDDAIDLPNDTEAYESETTETDNEETPTEAEKTELEQKKIRESYMIGFDYFVNQLWETDQFIGALISKLALYDEPTVVVFYGDHLPSMSFENGDLSNDNKFQTEYVMWSNFKMKQVNRDLSAYQLNAYVMERLGYDNGILTKLHQNYVTEPDYEEELEMLQYDMLYGDRNVFEGENPFVEKTIQMGVLDIEITNILQKGEAIFIEGHNFTPWSVVYRNEEPQDTLFIDENTLIVPYENYTNEVIYVAQVSDGDTVLSQSKEWKPVEESQSKDIYLTY